MVAGNVARWWACGIAVAGVAVAAGGIAAAQGHGTAAAASDAPASAAGTLPDPGNYFTDVHPGNAIMFPDGPQVGWRLDGQGVNYTAAGNAQAGPGETLGWSGTSVSVSQDGGRTWTTRYRDPEGIWGLDFISGTTGWVVGVTSLVRTSDGGRTWQRVAEPAADQPENPLVTVDFTSAATGYGLNASGRLYATGDGGLTWTRVTVPGAGGAVCFDDAAAGYVSGLDGDLYRTGDGGRTWARVHTSPFGSGFTSLWTTLACSGHSVWQGLECIDLNYSQGGQPSLVLASADDGRTWTVADQDLDETEDFTVPAGPDVVADLAGIAVSAAGTAVMAGLVPGTSAVMAEESGDTWGVVTAVSGPSGRTEAPVRFRPRVPGVPASDGENSDYVIHGISFDGETGWLYLDDFGVGTPGNEADRTLVYRTEDGGRSWSPIQQSTS